MLSLFYFLYLDNFYRYEVDGSGTSTVSLQPLKVVKRQIEKDKLVSKDQSEIVSGDSASNKTINGTSTDAVLPTESGNLAVLHKT